MPKLFICRGLPASGKTTWAKELINEALDCLDVSTPTCGNPSLPGHKVVRVNRDDIRNMLHDSRYIKGVTEEVVIAVRDSAISSSLRKGWDVISDDTNLKSGVVRDLLKIANRAGAEVEFKDFTDVSVEECIRRDAERERNASSPEATWQDWEKRHVGEEVIRDQYNRFIRGRGLPLPIPDLKSEPRFLPVQHGDIPAIIVDIDGTLAYNNGHRGFYEYDKVGYDTPVGDVIDAVRGLFFTYGAVFILSGRSDSCYDTTRDWILDHVFWDSYLVEDGREAAKRLVPHGIFLLMRADGDHRDDAVVKYELYRDHIAPRFDVKMVFDDRDRVVRMWRQIGLTCSQVAYGDF